MTKRRLLWRCLAKALACAALLGCPGAIHHGALCGPANCDGCCDELGLCHSATALGAWDGGAGERCLWCARAPVQDSGIDAGPDVPVQDAGTDGEADAGRCGPGNCKDGCCQNGTCVLNTSSSACGIAGTECLNCGGSPCDAGMCGGCKLVITALAGPDGHLLDFGSQAVGTTSTQWAQLINLGALSCEVTRLTPSPSMDQKAFSVATSPSLMAGTVDVSPGAALTVTATFNPGSNMSYLASANTFTLETGDPSPTECSAVADFGCKQFALKGSGR